jgi:predicted RNA methylase
VNAIERLLMLQQENNQAGARILEMRPRFIELKQRHELGTAPRAITGFNLFQTPRPVAARMAALIRERIGDGARVLEPSAGLGRLIEPFEQDTLRARWVAVENARECVKALKKALRGASVHERDFLETSAGDIGGEFDAVIMNPPFKQGRDVKHIRHALAMLKPGGRLVSLCYNGTKQNEQLRPLAGHWEVLPEGSFKDEGTAASVALLVIDK